MADAIIENPILNSPFEEPNQHFKFTDDGITNQIVETRRLSGYFIPIPQPKKKGKQLVFDSEWTQDRFKESEFINRIRDRVKVWRQQGWPGVTNATARLLQLDGKPPLRPPRHRQDAIKVINHYGDEVLKVYEAWGEERVKARAETLQKRKSGD